MNKSTIARLAGAILVLVMLVGGFTPAAAAASTAVTPSAASAGVPMYLIPGGGTTPVKKYPSSACQASSTTAGSSSLLPVNRWADSTANLHHRLDNFAGLDTALIVQRDNIMNAGMAAGNTMWSLGTGLAAFSINFCILNELGGFADQMGAKVGNAINGSGIVAFLVIGSVFVLLFQSRRRGGLPWKQILMKAAVLGIFGAMIAGSTASTGGGKLDSDADYRPGVMSPGWIVTTMNNTVSSLASAPAAALAVDVPETDVLTGKRHTLSCATYMNELKNTYQSRYGSGTTKLSASVPIVMSSLWENTGLLTWRTAQFGVPSETSLDRQSWCRLLEWNSTGVKVDTAASDSVRAIMAKSLSEGGAPGQDSAVWRSPAFNPGPDNVIRDRSLMAWSICETVKGKPDAWQINSTFSSGDKEAKNYDAADCKDWWSNPTSELKAFDFSGNGDNIGKRTTGDELNMTSATNVRNYIQTMHGNTNTQGSTAVITYNIAAGAMLLVFGLVSLAIIIAKVAMVVMIMMAFFVVIAALMPSATMDKLGGFIKMLLGMNVFVFAIQLIFALITIISQMLSQMGQTFLGDGNLVSIIWTGFSPLIAVFLLHMMFTKVMKVPSPFKLSGGLAWGAAAGTAGGAAFAGMSSLLDRRAGMAGARAKNMAKRSGSALLSKSTGGKLGSSVAAGANRKGAAVPDAGKAIKGKDGQELKAPSTIAGQRRGAIGSKGAAAAAASGAGTGVIDGAAGKGAAGIGEGRRGSADPSSDSPIQTDNIAASASPGRGDAIEDIDDVTTGSIPAVSTNTAQLEVLNAGAAAAGKTRQSPMQRAEALAGGITVEDLAVSRVANSRLASEKGLRAEDRIALANAGKLERAQATKWARENHLPGTNTRGDAVIEAYTDAREAGQGRIAAAGNTVKGMVDLNPKRNLVKAADSLSLAYQDFKSRPFQASKNFAGKTVKYAAIGTGVMATFPFGIGAVATAGTAAGAVAAYKAVKGAQHLKERPTINDQRVEQYRAHVREQMTAAKKAQEEQAKAQKADSRKPSQGTAGGTSNTSPEVEGHGTTPKHRPVKESLPSNGVKAPSRNAGSAPMPAPPSNSPSVQGQHMPAVKAQIRTSPPQSAPQGPATVTMKTASPVPGRTQMIEYAQAVGHQAGIQSEPVGRPTQPGL